MTTAIIEAKLLEFFIQFKSDELKSPEAVQKLQNLFSISSMEELENNSGYNKLYKRYYILQRELEEVISRIIRTRLCPVHSCLFK